MEIDVVTIFPEMLASALGASLLGKAVARGDVTVRFCDPRGFTDDKHRSVDDAPYGGGAGMVMRPEPLVSALETIERTHGAARKIALSPAGARLDQATVNRLAAERHLVLLCGRYEGFDERVRAFLDEELSIGDYVLSGGEPAALVLIDAIARRLPGVVGNAASVVDESHEAGTLEYPHYTRPTVFRGQAVPEVLLSGDHERVRKWRRTQSLLRTRERRPDLFARLTLTDEDRALLAAVETK